MNRYHSPESQAPGSPIGLGESGVGGIGSRQQAATDSFGLRGLLANTTSFRDDVQPTSRFSVAPPTSSGEDLRTLLNQLVHYLNQLVFG